MILRSSRRVSGVFGLALAATAAGGVFTSGAASAAPPPCTTEITGTYTGSVNVHSGVVCIHDAHVTGSVLATGPVTLAVVNSQVDGAISTAKAALVVVCGSVTGTVSVTSTQGDVIVANTGNACPRNTVHGNITVTKNRAGVRVVGNAYTGVIAATANTGSPIDISANTKI